MDANDLLARFWRELGQLRTGMLGLASEDGSHAHPMTAHFEGEHGPLWFYGRRDSGLVQRAAQSHPAVFHYVAKGHDLYACVHGDIRAVTDRNVVKMFWSEEVARWYPGGEHDPDLALLRFDPSSAQIWCPDHGDQPRLFGLEKSRPVDIHAEVRL
jgi:general stress protein 26